MPSSSSQVQSREDTERLLRSFLKTKGYDILNEPRANGEQGPAVIAEKDGVRYFIEVIGAKSQGPSRSVDFRVALCQAISRQQGRKNEISVIAMPEVYFLKGMPARVRRLGEYAWRKLGESFPLELWFISSGCLEQYQWNEFA